MAKVTTAKINKYIRATFTHTDREFEKRFNDASFVITVKNSLNAIETAQLVQNVIDELFPVDSDSGIVSYLPQFKEFVCRAEILEAFTNIKFKDKFSAEHVENTYTICFNGDIYDTVVSLIDTLYLDSIFDAIDEAIDFKKKDVFTNNKAKIQELIDSFEKISAILNTLADGISPDEFKTALSKLSSIDDSAIVKALAK